MKITKVSFERHFLQLKNPYTIAYETIKNASNFFLQIETDGRIVGLGCAAPDKEVTGESDDETTSVIKSLVIPFLTGKNPLNYVQILTELKILLPKSPSVLAMVDMALFDIFAKKAEVPLYQFLGGFRHEIATSITVGILPLKETLYEVEEFVDQGFNIIKIKGGLNVEEDIERVNQVHQKYPKLALRFDGNQGYNKKETIKFVEETKKVGIEILEQPTKIHKRKKLAKITKQVDIPVMADESIKSLADAFHLAKNSIINMINIKLMKVGGIQEAKHINSVAKSGKIEVMVGCLDESALGISAGLHFALSRPNIEYADLDGHLDFINDPVKNIFILEKGVLRPNQEFGLGLKSF
ncbi:mandelate racemase/muconate lactonizing enzyme family protein [Namhaeicola litoreus]|uniref:Dipeptide epimerase n=1 Tax=Namhaeicola litoreus TaxID=1052145 RepID=A0ABW3Y0K1_9FLAO